MGKSERAGFILLPDGQGVDGHDRQYASRPIPEGPAGRMSEPQSDLVGVVMVNWNGWQHTIAACRSLQQSTHRAIKPIVVDNASTDGSLARLRAEIPEAEIIANPVNAGFAGGCNVGIRRARELGCGYIFLLNNDALAETETLAQLVEASRKKNDTAILGSAVLYLATGGYQFFGARAASKVSGFKYFFVETEGALLRLEFIETDYVIGAALFAPTKLFEQMGLFDERFFLNYEEVDLCFRARSLGIPSFVVPASVIRHHANASLGPEQGPLQAYFRTRNELLFAKKHGTFSQRVPMFRYLLAKLYWDIRRSWEKGLLIDPPARAMVRALWDYAWGRFGDCPLIIRRLHATASAKSAPPAA